MTQKTLLTAETFCREYAGKPGKYELVRGEAVEMTPPGGADGSTAAAITVALGSYLKSNPRGKLLVESGYVLQRRPDTVRGPDVSLVLTERIPPGGIPQGYLPVVPDLVVEVVSPWDTAAEVAGKVHDYQKAGVPCIWVFYPQDRRAQVYPRDGPARWYAEDDVLDGGDLLPGFAVPVRDFFI